MKRTNIFIISLTVCVILAGCELVGLELQKKYDYDAKAGILSNELNMTVWEFLNSRPDAFSLIMEGIHYAGLEDMYSQPNSTYMVLTNAAFTNAVVGYFSSHPLPNPDYDPSDPSKGAQFTIAFSLEQFPKEQVRELLLYHIAKGTYTWSNLPPVATWYDTYASADTAKVSMYLMKNDRSPTIGWNDFPSHYLPAIKARTTNLKASNGSYVHVLDAYLNYPTRQDLE